MTVRYGNYAISDLSVQELQKAGWYLNKLIKKELQENEAAR